MKTHNCYAKTVIAFTFILVFCIGGLTTQNPTEFIHEETNTAKKLPSLPNPSLGPGDEWTFDYGNDGVISTFQHVLSDGSLLLVVNDQSQSVSEDIFFGIYPAETVDKYGSDSYHEYAEHLLTDSSDDVIVIGRKTENIEYGDFSGFICKYSATTRNFLFTVDIEVGDKCSIEEYQILSNTNLLILVSYFIGNDMGMLLMEINSNTGAIEWEKDCWAIEYDSWAFSDHGLHHLHLTTTEEIVVIGQNDTDASVFISRGSIGGTWNNQSYSQNVDLMGCVVDNNGYVHLALERINSISTLTEIDIVKIASNGDIATNYTFSHGSRSFTVENFWINSESASYNYPFLLYNVDENGNQGFGFCYIDGTTLLQNIQPQANSEYSYYSTEMLPYDGDFIFNVVASFGSSKLITIYRVGSVEWENSFQYLSEYAAVFDFQISGNKLWMRLADTSEHRGIYQLNLDFGYLEQTLEVDDKSILCHFHHFIQNEVEYLALYGFEGDITEMEGVATFSIYNLADQEIRKEIRLEEVSDYNENWDWLYRTDTSFYLVGIQSASQPDYVQNAIVAKYSIDNMLSKKLRKYGQIAINGQAGIDLYDDIITGTGTASDPYVIEFLEIDGIENDNPSGTGIILQNIGSNMYLEIKNCIIANWQSYGIDIRWSRHVTIYNCTLKSNGYDGTIAGIFFAGVYECNISHNFIDESRGFGLMTSTYEESSDNFIEYNTITNTHRVNDEDWTGSGIGLEQGYRNQIIYNTINDNDGFGIRVGGVWDEDGIITAENIISHNNLCENGDGGINFDEMVDYDVNTFENNTCGEVPENPFSGIPGYNLNFFAPSLIFGLGIVVTIVKKRQTLNP